MGQTALGLMHYRVSHIGPRLLLLVVVPWGCDFMGCDFEGCDFKGCDLKGCDFKGCDFLILNAFLNGF